MRYSRKNSRVKEPNVMQNFINTRALRTKAVYCDYTGSEHFSNRPHGIKTHNKYKVVHEESKTSEREDGYRREFAGRERGRGSWQKVNGGLAGGERSCCQLRRLFRPMLNLWRSLSLSSRSSWSECPRLCAVTSSGRTLCPLSLAAADWSRIPLRRPRVLAFLFLLYTPLARFQRELYVHERERAKSSRVAKGLGRRDSLPVCIHHVTLIYVVLLIGRLLSVGARAHARTTYRGDFGDFFFSSPAAPSGRDWSWR